MTRLGFIVRLLMLAACLVPFTSARQASALLALKSTAPVTGAPVEHEDDSQREELSGSKDKARAHRLRLDHRSIQSYVLYRLPALQCVDPKPVARHLHAPAPVDPFHNGLGSPYLC